MSISSASAIMPFLAAMSRTEISTFTNQSSICILLRLRLTNSYQAMTRRCQMHAKSEIRQFCLPINCEPAPVLAEITDTCSGIKGTESLFFRYPGNYTVIMVINELAG